MPAQPSVTAKSAASYDVVVTENLFGDILTDEASMLAGKAIPLNRSGL